MTPQEQIHEIQLAKGDDKAASLAEQKLQGGRVEPAGVGEEEISKTSNLEILD